MFRSDYNIRMDFADKRDMKSVGEKILKIILEDYKSNDAISFEMSKPKGD